MRLATDYTEISSYPRLATACGEISSSPAQTNLWGNICTVSMRNSPRCLSVPVYTDISSYLQLATACGEISSFPAQTNPSGNIRKVGGQNFPHFLNYTNCADIYTLPSLLTKLGDICILVSSPAVRRFPHGLVCAGDEEFSAPQYTEMSSYPRLATRDSSSSARTNPRGNLRTGSRKLRVRSNLRIHGCEILLVFCTYLCIRRLLHHRLATVFKIYVWLAIQLGKDLTGLS